MRTIITFPADTLFGSFSVESQRFDMDEVSDLSGEVDTIVYGHPRWKFSLSAPDDMSLAQSSAWESITLRMKGKLNRLAVYDPVRVMPAGTVRGVISLASGTPSRAEEVHLVASAGQGGTTLLVGDLLQVGTGYGTSQMVKVIEDVTFNASGTAVVQIAPYLRKAYSMGTLVTYEKPVCYCGFIQGPGGWSYKVNAPLVAGFSMDLLEQWT